MREQVCQIRIHYSKFEKYKLKKSKINLLIRIAISIFPFIPIALAINNKNYDHWIPPVAELTALCLIIFSNLYLLTELLIMRSKGLYKKMKNNFILIIVCSLAPY